MHSRTATMSLPVGAVLQSTHCLLSRGALRRVAADLGMQAAGMFTIHELPVALRDEASAADEMRCAQ